MLRGAVGGGGLIMLFYIANFLWTGPGGGAGVQKLGPVVFGGIRQIIIVRLWLRSHIGHILRQIKQNKSSLTFD